MSIEIERAKIEDYESFLDIFFEIGQLHQVNVPWKFNKPSSEIFSKEYYLETLTNKDSFFIIAKDEGEVIGYILAFKRMPSDNPIFKERTYVSIEDLAVKNGHQKRGVGTLLMDELEKQLKISDINDIELNVWSFNQNAISFYEKKGYVTFSQKMRKILK